MPLSLCRLLRFSSSSVVMASQSPKNVDRVDLASLKGVFPPSNQSLLEHARSNNRSYHYRWSWSGFRDAHRIRRWRWDECRIAASHGSPLVFDPTLPKGDQICYIREEDMLELLGKGNDEDQTAHFNVKLVLFFTKDTSAPYAPSIGSNTLSNLLGMFGIQWLQDHYPSQIVTSLVRDETSLTDTCSKCFDPRERML